MTDSPADIGTLSVAEIGWTRVNGHTLRWIGQPIPDGGGRYAMQLKGCGPDLAITTTYLDDDVDIADDEAITAELHWAPAAVLPLPALVVLRHGLNSAIEAMESAQNVTIEYGEETA